MTRHTIRTRQHQGMLLSNRTHNFLSHPWENVEYFMKERHFIILVSWVNLFVPLQTSFLDTRIIDSIVQRTAFLIRLYTYIWIEFKLIRQPVLISLDLRNQPIIDSVTHFTVTGTRWVTSPICFNTEFLTIYTFCYKKVVYKKVRATEANKIRNFRDPTL